jgi:hypothetical protein
MCNMAAPYMLNAFDTWVQKFYNVLVVRQALFA